MGEVWEGGAEAGWLGHVKEGRLGRPGKPKGGRTQSNHMAPWCHGVPPQPGKPNHTTKVSWVLAGISSSWENKMGTTTEMLLKFLPRQAAGRQAGQVSFSIGTRVGWYKEEPNGARVHPLGPAPPIGNGPKPWVGKKGYKAMSVTVLHG